MPPILFEPHVLAIAVILAFAAGWFFAPRLSRLAARLRWLFVGRRAVSSAKKAGDWLDLHPEPIATKASDDNK